MIHRLVLFGFVWRLSCAVASGEVLTKGLPVDTAMGAMKAAGYTKTILEMGPRAEDKDQDLRFWAVDQGVLIVNYSKTTDEILSLRIWFADERPKALRQTFAFDVIAFDTDTGKMKIRTRKSKPAGRSDRPAKQRRTKP